MDQEPQRPASIGKVKVEAFGTVTTPCSASIERIEHDIAFLGRALVDVIDGIVAEDWEAVNKIRGHVQALVDFYENLMDR